MDNTIIRRCLNAAYRYLSYRARSEAELWRYLHKCGFSDEVVAEAIVGLKEQSLIDDLAFAKFWRDSRLYSRPRSKRLIARELKEKKVAQEIIEQVTENIDDEDNAYILGSNRMRMFAHLDYPEFQRGLSNYLAYRGFSYSVIRRTAGRLWQERHGEPDIVQIDG